MENETHNIKIGNEIVYSNPSDINCDWTTTANLSSTEERKYEFYPKLTKWNQVQYYIQNLVAKCLKESAGSGMKAEYFQQRLMAYDLLFDVLNDYGEYYLTDLLE